MGRIVKRRLPGGLLASLILMAYFTRWWKWRDLYAGKPPWYILQQFIIFFAIGFAASFLVPVGLDYLWIKLMRQRERRGSVLNDPDTDHWGE